MRAGTGSRRSFSGFIVSSQRLFKSIARLFLSGSSLTENSSHSAGVSEDLREHKVIQVFLCVRFIVKEAVIGLADLPQVGSLFVNNTFRCRISGYCR